MTNSTKKWIGGAVCGLVVGALVGGFTMTAIIGTAFVNYAFKQDELKNTNIVGQTAITPERTNK